MNLNGNLPYNEKAGIWRQRDCFSGLEPLKLCRETKAGVSKLKDKKEMRNSILREKRNSEEV